MKFGDALQNVEKWTPAVDSTIHSVSNVNQQNQNSKAVPHHSCCHTKDTHQCAPLRCRGVLSAAGANNVGVENRCGESWNVGFPLCSGSASQRSTSGLPNCSVLYRLNTLLASFTQNSDPHLAHHHPECLPCPWANQHQKPQKKGKKSANDF